MVEQSKANFERVYRKSCHCEIQGGVTHLERQGKTDKHIKKG